MATRTAPRIEAAREGPLASVATGPMESRGHGHGLRRVLVVAFVLAAVLGGGGWFYFPRPPHDESRLVLQGNVDVRQVNLAFKVEGRIHSLVVDEGDAVTAGQVVATLDKRYFDDDLRAATARRDDAAANLARLEHGSRPEEIEQARAQHALQQANFTLARANYKRGEELAPSGGISKEDLDGRRQTVQVGEANVKYSQQVLRLAEIGPRQEDIDGGRAQLQQQEAAVVQSQRRLADSELIAPGAGIILTRTREKGAIVQPGESVFLLTLASPVWVRTYVNEKDLGRIRPAMKAEVRTDSDPRKVYPARIGFISPTAEFTPKTVETRELRTDLVYRLRVVVDNPDGGLRQGMPVTVTLLVGETKQNDED
jgi:HlyD family secretion protein